MNRYCIAAVLWLAAVCPLMAAETRVWTDTTGRYTLEAELIAFSDATSCFSEPTNCNARDR